MSTNRNHSDLQENVLSTLVYFDIFNYPLKACEILNFLPNSKVSQECVNECLLELAKSRRVFRFGDLYTLQADEAICLRRLRGNTEAERWLKVAEKKANFIGKFPFVRAVMASGSLSKGYMDENSDLDFFIVTAPRRLWIARTLLVMYKRIFLHNSHKEFCVNYFVDLDHLEIEEKNIYTATELATLIPLYDESIYKSVLESNCWVRAIFPNYQSVAASGERPVKSLLKQLIEVIIYPLTDWLDRFFMGVSLRRWFKIYGGCYCRDDFEIAFTTKRHVSKNHPNNYQKKVLERFQRKLAELEKRLEPADNL